MEIQSLSHELNSLSYSLIAISPSIFVFSVTLLGTAIDQSQNEEKAARENSKAVIKDQIDEVEKGIIIARKDGDTSELTSKLEELKRKSIGIEKEIEKIRNRYKRINLLNTVVVPCLVSIIAIFISIFLLPYLKHFLIVYILFIIQIILISFGFFKLYRTLDLVQYISSAKKEKDYFPKLKETLKEVLEEHLNSIKEEAEVSFIDKSFPLNVTTDMELKVDFRIRIIKGDVLKETQVWFYIDDGFEIIKPPENLSWRQPADYSLPNIRTVKVKIGTLSKGPFMTGNIILKTPKVTGKYLLRYGVRAEGYSGPNKDLTILVG